MESKRSLDAKARAALLTPDQKQIQKDLAAAGRKVAALKRQEDRAKVRERAPALVKEGRKGAPTPDALRKLKLHEAYEKLQLQHPEQDHVGGYASVPNLCLPKLGIDCVDQAIVIEYLKREWWIEKEQARRLPFPSAATIGANIGVDSEAILKRISAMEAKGYCRKIVRNKDGKNSSFSVDWTGLFYAQRALDAERRSEQKSTPSASGTGKASTPSGSGTEDVGTPSGSGTAPDGDRV